MRSALGTARDLDRRVRPMWAQPKPRRRHRAPGPAKLPTVLALMLGFLVIRPIL
jgi:hypothetical protein